MFAIRMLVTMAIILPYFLIRQPHDTIEIFIVAVLGFGSGRLVEMALKQRKAKQTPLADRP